MTSPTPPTTRGALERREARLAWSLLLPTILIVSLVIVLPLLSIFWISFKPVGLADLRPVAPVIRESLRERSGQMVVEYRVRNSSQSKEIIGLGFTDRLHDGVVFGELPAPCTVTGQELQCTFGDVPGGFNERVRIPVTLDGDADALEEIVEGSKPRGVGTGDNILTNSEFTLENFVRIFDGDEFLSVLWATVFYTVFGTVGALVIGLFAAMLLNKSFRGKGVLRGLYLFPY